MRERFVQLWHRACKGASADVVSAAFAELEALYAQPWRAYHTMDHVSACLVKFDEVAAALDDPDSVQMAIWYHDAIYDLSSPNFTPNNEADSAVLCGQRIGSFASAAFTAKVNDLVLVTRYPSEVTSSDQAYMCDIDLHSFGLPWEAFEADGKAVRAENPGRSEQEFHASQCRFMRSLLDNGHFYRSPYYQQHYQAQAHSNVERHLALYCDPTDDGQCDLAGDNA